MRIAEITMFFLVILLTISVGINVFHYTTQSLDPVPEIVTVSDTVIRIDTIFHTLTQQVTIDLPVPVYIDTTTNIRTYRDTIYLPHGTINREELVLGEILKHDLTFDVKLPEVFNTITITNSTTQTIR